MYDLESKETINVTIPIKLYDIECLLIEAFEQSSTYWIHSIKKPANGKTAVENVMSGGSVTIYVLDESNGRKMELNGKTEFTLNPKAIEAGITVMAEKWPRHLADILIENPDATTSDVFLQCALFQDIIFG